MKHSSKKILVAIVMGSRSDYKVMREAEEALDLFGISYESQVVSAHRTPKEMFEFAQGAYQRGIRVVIAGAGGAAHLPGMIASLTSVPVIGVPVQSKTMKGLDSLLSIAQMPKGVPVACVAVDSAFNAGLLAAKMLLDSPRAPRMLREKLDKYRERLRRKVVRSRRL